MKIWLKIIIIFVIFLIVIIFPFPERSSFELDDSVLLMNYRIGGWVGYEVINVFYNGSVEYTYALENLEHINTKISEEELQKLKQFINQRQYSIKTESISEFIWTNFLSGCADCGSSNFLINRNGKAIVIKTDKIPSDIIFRIDEETLSERYNYSNGKKSDLDTNITSPDILISEEDIIPEFQI